MNKTQRIIILIGLALIILMGIFPPWHLQHTNGVRIFWGYNFINPILDPVVESGINMGTAHLRIETDLLNTQLFFVTIVVTGLILIFHKRED
ncbi:hypothetical protein ACFL67_01495 [candidate division KSB1 bacterium]